MNFKGFIPQRKKPVKRLRLRCGHCGRPVSIVAGLTPEEAARKVVAGEEVRLQPHACTFALDDTAELSKLTALPVKPPEIPPKRS